VTPPHVLLVNHTGQVSGAEHSLLALIGGLSALGLKCTLACPVDGPLASLAREANIEVRRITGTTGSLRLHPTHTAKAIGELAVTALQVARLARMGGADIIHANSLRASLSAGMSSRAIGAPAVAHLRDRLPPSPASTACLRMVNSTCSAVIANSSFTAAALPEAGIGRPPVVIGNPVDLDRFRPLPEAKRASVRSRLGLTDNTIALGVVGQITPWKAQDMAIEVLKRLVRDLPTLRLLIVGEAKFLNSSARQDSAGYLEQLQHAAQDPLIEGRVDFLGERSDIPDVMRALDVLLLPSIGEPFGRVVVEAMAAGTPVVASSDGGPGEIIEHEVTGMLVDPLDLNAWADATRTLISNKKLRRDIVTAGLLRSKHYSIKHHTEKVIDVYRNANVKSFDPAPASPVA
jgi:glycosyltransferase involved in cell wall biosynthesis